MAKKKVVRSQTLVLTSKLIADCSNPPSPAKPNGGVVLGCALGDTIYVSSLPFLPGENDPCYFHCALFWSAPNNWLFRSNPPGYPVMVGGSPFNGYYGYYGNMQLIVPSSGVSPGLVGVVSLSAIYTMCGAPHNTTSSSQLWFGSPAVNNGKVNSNPYSGGTVYVPSGYAVLNVQIGGGGSTNWYVANGSGSVSPSYDYCNVSWNGFVRVVVDASNRCGSGGSYTFYLSTQQGYYGYKVAPNPAKDQLSIMMEMKEMAGELIQSVDLYNDKSKLFASVGPDKLKSGFYEKTTIDINVKDFPRGTYFLHVQMKNHTEKHQIILN